MKRRIALCLVLLFSLAVLAFLNAETESVMAESVTVEGESVSAAELVDETDLSGLENYYNGLDESSKALFGGNIAEFVKRIVNGEIGVSFDGIASFVTNALILGIRDLLPMIITLVVVTILSSLVNTLKGNFSSSSVESVVNFASIALISTVVLVQVIAVVNGVSSLVSSLKGQMETVFPLLLTFMSALGASGSMAVYQPAVATLTFSVTTLISTVSLPLMLSTVALSVVGNLSSSVKLGAMSKFLDSAGKWIMYCTFFIFIAFLSVNGITASVYDNMSVRTAKFALSKYVPVIGGYLSEGFNLILAGTVLVKNAVGLTAVILLLVSVIPVILRIILLSLALKLSSALTEPYCDGKITGIFNSLSGSVSSLSAVVLGVAFSYFIFIVLLICSGNLVL